MIVAKIKITGTNVEVSDLKTITSGMVGAKVDISYDRSWSGLSKQVVFKTPSCVMNADDTIIPHELLVGSDYTLKVGVYGYTDDMSVVIPTVYADLGRVKPGADPDGDEAAKPTLPVWARMQAQIDEVEESFNDLAVSTKAALAAANNAASDAAEHAVEAAAAASEASGKATAAESKADSASTEAAAANAAAASASATASAASEKSDALEQRLDQLESSVNTGLTELDTLIGGE